MRVVLFYVDYGKPYLPLIEQMCESAREHIPEAKLTLLTDGPTQAAKFFDDIVELDIKIPPETLCKDRARAMVSWMKHTKEDTIFVDPDVVFLKRPVFHEAANVQLLWRPKPDQPINTGLILAKPGPMKFWERYGTVAVNLPGQIHHWWCDQLAFALITGVCHKAGEILERDDAKICLMDAKAIAPRSHDPIPSSAWMVHYKGRQGKADAAGKFSPPSSKPMASNAVPSLA